MSRYGCGICGKIATHIAIIYYPFIKDMYVSTDYLICSDKNCQQAISRELTEGSRDKNVQIYPLNFDSLKLIPDQYREEREKLKKIILQSNLARGIEKKALENLKQTKQDKPTDLKLIQGNLFHILEENH